MKIDLLPILNKMDICGMGRDDVVRRFGKHPTVNRRNLEQAYDFRGQHRFSQFLKAWLEWDHSLREHVYIVGTKAFLSARLTSHKAASDKEREVWVSAALAYIEEMNKP